MTGLGGGSSEKSYTPQGSASDRLGNKQKFGGRKKKTQQGIYKTTK